MGYSALTVQNSVLTLTVQNTVLRTTVEFRVTSDTYHIQSKPVIR